MGNGVFIVPREFRHHRVRNHYGQTHGKSIVEHDRNDHVELVTLKIANSTELHS